MPWVGVAENCPKAAEAEEVLKSLGFTVLRRFRVELEVEGEWLGFTVFDVLGFAEGVAQVIAAELECPALESGPHLVLGEISAKIWDEAAKVVFPDGREVLVPVFTYDAFLDLVLPTKKVRGIEGRITIMGRSFKLPLSREDLLEIMKLGSKFLEKVEKAIAVYGVERVLSPLALRELAQREKGEGGEMSYEVDFDEGVALVKVGGKLTMVPIPRLVVMLAQRGRLEEVERLLENLKGEELSKTEEALLDLYSMLGDSGEVGAKLKELLAKRGLLGTS